MSLKGHVAQPSWLLVTGNVTQIQTVLWVYIKMRQTVRRSESGNWTALFSENTMLFFVPLWFCFCSFCLEGCFFPLQLYTHLFLSGPGLMSPPLRSPFHCFRRLGAFCASSDIFIPHLYVPFYRFKSWGKCVGTPWVPKVWGRYFVCIFTPSPSWGLGTDAGVQQHLMHG